MACHHGWCRHVFFFVDVLWPPILLSLFFLQQHTSDGAVRLLIQYFNSFLFLLQQFHCCSLYSLLIASSCYLLFVDGKLFSALVLRFQNASDARRLVLIECQDCWLHRLRLPLMFSSFKTWFPQVCLTWLSRLRLFRLTYFLPFMFSLFCTCFLVVWRASLYVRVGLAAVICAFYVLLDVYVFCCRLQPPVRTFVSWEVGWTMWPSFNGFLSSFVWCSCFSCLLLVDERCLIVCPHFYILSFRSLYRSGLHPCFATFLAYSSLAWASSFLLFRCVDERILFSDFVLFLWFSHCYNVVLTMRDGALWSATWCWWIY